MKAILLLQDGTTFTGKGFGARGISTGEVVFHTGMTGYQEIVTDPSYKGQIVTMTYPHIGNYGFNPEDFESPTPHIEALIVKEACTYPHNHRCTENIDTFMKRFDIMGIEDIDTRALTRHIREKGSMKGIMSCPAKSIKELKTILDEHPSIQNTDLVNQVTTDKPFIWEEKVDTTWYYAPVTNTNASPFTVIAYDFGIKHTILRLMTALNFKVEVVPATTSHESIMERKPDGIFLSNGPGDPEQVSYAVENVKKLAGKIPLFGICLGHQILALALGGITYKLKYGHHGSNHPVQDIQTGKIEITSQNHNFAVKQKSIEKNGFTVTHINLNDNTVEGMEHTELPVFSIQYHPEASPGPHDSLDLFKKFYTMIKEFS